MQQGKSRKKLIPRTIRFDRAEFDAIKVAAKRDSRSLNNFVVRAASAAAKAVTKNGR